MHGDGKVYDAARVQACLDFAFLHEGSVCVELRGEFPVLMREKVEVETRILRAQREVERVGADAVHHEAVGERNFDMR